MANIIHEGKHAAEFILYDEGDYSRDAVVIASAAGALVPGTLLGKVTASGKYVAYSNTATDGSEVARAINLFAVPDSAADQTVAAITRLAEVAGAALTGLDAAGKADLLAAGIVVR